MSAHPASEPAPSRPPPGLRKVRLVGPRARLGRRIASGLVYAAGGALAITATVQISMQAFAEGAGGSPYATCHDGLRALASSTERARDAASGIEGEDAAVSRFRATLAPTWAHRDEIARSCRGRERDERALDAIERLRYAEEHAARLEAGDLAPLRRRVQAILETELGIARELERRAP